MWDYILTVRDEVRLMWKGKMRSVVLACFFWIRYVAMGCLLYATYRE